MKLTGRGSAPPPQPPLARLRTAMFSSPGGRSDNEDAAAYSVEDGWACWVVADGLGGHSGGEEASQRAVMTVIDAAAAAGLAVTPDRLAALVQRAHEEIVTAQQQAGGHPSMRSTIAVLATDRRVAAWAHVGDTRLYHFRGGALLAQTLDHSVPQMLVAAGQLTSDQLRGHEDRARLLRALGQKEPLRAAACAAPVPLLAGDAFLLCTDGWWEYVTEPEMEIDLVTTADPDKWLERMRERIFARARGEFDNLTAIAVLVD